MLGASIYISSLNLLGTTILTNERVVKCLARGHMGFLVEP